MADVEVRRDVTAPADTVWALLADLSRMPEWSPENERVEWLGGMTAAAPGARFRGTNRNGSKSWKSQGEITELDDGRRLVFRVKAGPFPVAEWRYEVEPTSDGCRVTEAWTDRRGTLMRTLSRFATGVADRPSHNRQGMEETLRRLAAAAEAASSTGSAGG
jgi:uncharacterized protein YndB with AHSA1/START domain